MRDKDNYLDALKKSNGRHNILDLGAQMGLDENATMELIAQLLSEFKIEYSVNGHCDYSPIKARKIKPKNRDNK